MLRGEAGAFAHELAQLFRMDAFGAGRINGDRAQYSALLHQTCKSAVTGSPRRLTHPSQPAHRRAVPACQQSIQRLDLRRKQASGQLIGDLALGKRRCRRDQTLDDGSTRSDNFSAPQLVRQSRGNCHGIRIPERDRQQAREQLTLVFRGKHAEAKCRPQRAQLLAPGLVACGVIGECPGGNAKLAGNKGECCLRNDLARTQQAPGIAENTELQRETKLVRIAATTLYGGEIGDTQGPVPDQFGFGDRQGKQLLELLADDGAASRHG